MCNDLKFSTYFNLIYLILPTNESLALFTAIETESKYKLFLIILINSRSTFKYGVIIATIH